MAESLILKQGGGVGSDELTATVAQILSGYTAVTKDSDDEIGTGTMPNRGAVSQTLNAGGTYTIPQGYHNGNGQVSANSLGSQTQANAVAANLTSGKTAWVNGKLVTGNGGDNQTFYNNGHSVGYAEGQASMPKTASGQLVVQALDIMQPVTCGFKPNHVVITNLNRYSTYIYDNRLSYVLFGYANGNLNPISEDYYSELSFNVTSTGFQFMVKFSYVGDTWMWFACQ